MRLISTLETVSSVIVWSGCGENGHGGRIMRILTSVVELANHGKPEGYALQKSPNEHVLVQ